MLLFFIASFLILSMFVLDAECSEYMYDVYFEYMKVITNRGGCRD